ALQRGVFEDGKDIFSNCYTVARRFIISIALRALPSASPKRLSAKTWPPRTFCLPVPKTRKVPGEISSMLSEHEIPLQDPQLIPVWNVTRPTVLYVEKGAL